MEFLQFLPQVVADFVGRNLGWLIPVGLAPVGGSLLTWIYNKTNPGVKFGDWLNGFGEKWDDWLDKVFIPTAKAGEPQGKWLTTYMTGKIGGFWNAVGEKLFALFVNFLLLRIVVGGLLALVRWIKDYLMYLMRGTEYDNR